MGVNHSTKGTETVNAINNLALITGNIGRAGASPFSITGQCNAMGTREAGFASCLPGYRKFESRAIGGAGAHLERAGRADPDARGSPIPTSSRPRSTSDPRALDHRDESDRLVPEPGVLQQALEGSSSWSCRTVSPDARRSEYADLVLPAAIWGEKEGTYTNSERGSARRTVRSIRRERPSPTSTSSSRSPTRSGFATSCFPAGRPGDAFDEWKRVSAARLCDYSG
jgi:assimilatory nitrate reductase catalytic subunit